MFVAPGLTGWTVCPGCARGVLGDRIALGRHSEGGRPGSCRETHRLPRATSEDGARRVCEKAWRRHHACHRAGWKVHGQPRGLSRGCCSTRVGGRGGVSRVSPRGTERQAAGPGAAATHHAHAAGAGTMCFDVEGGGARTCESVSRPVWWCAQHHSTEVVFALLQGTRDRMSPRGALLDVMVACAKANGAVQHVEVDTGNHSLIRTVAYRKSRDLTQSQADDLVMQDILEWLQRAVLHTRST